MIPVNTQKRRSELENYSEALERLKADFADATKTDDSYTGSDETENAIKAARRKILPKITHFEQVE